MIGTDLALTERNEIGHREGKKEEKLNKRSDCEKERGKFCRVGGLWNKEVGEIDCIYLLCLVVRRPFVRQTIALE